MAAAVARLHQRLTAHPHRTLAAALALLAAATATAVSLAATRHSGYPDQLPGSDSDVSAQQALRDHHITLPESALNLRYSANQHTENNDYPLAAEFTFACAEAPAFTAANALNQVADPSVLLDIAVYDLASNLGWNPHTPGASWYEHVEGTRATLSVLIQPSGGHCTGYLFSNKYTNR
jgi:hypothetical protein